MKNNPVRYFRTCGSRFVINKTKITNKVFHSSFLILYGYAGQFNNLPRIRYGLCQRNGTISSHASLAFFYSDN